MTKEQKAAYVMGQVVCAMCELEAMKAENRQRERAGMSPAYRHGDFMNLQTKYCISHNSIIMFLE